MLGEFLQTPFCRFMPWRQWLGWAGQTFCRIKLVGLSLTLVKSTKLLMSLARSLIAKANPCFDALKALGKSKT